MPKIVPAQAGEPHAAVVIVQVDDPTTLPDRIAELRDIGLFVQSDSPLPVGLSILVRYVGIDQDLICCAICEVEHARPALGSGDQAAGMKLRLLSLDDTAIILEGALPEAEVLKSAGRKEGLTRISGSSQPRLITLKGPVVGIDLGTVNSAIAISDQKSTRVVQAPGGYQTVPSVVHVMKDGDVVVGSAARERMVLEPEHTVYGSKRFLGRPFASREVRSLGHFFNYELVAGPKGRVAAKIRDRIVPLEEIASHIIGLLKQIAQHQLETEIQRAVITVPAYFGEDQRQAVRDAARLAGVHAERVLNEPTAAAAAYGLGRGLRETILVYDLGGGTFDVSILRIDADSMEVLATDGDPFLGGADFDDRLTEYALMLFEREHDFSFRDQPVSIQRVRFAAEAAKMHLSEATTAQINIPYVAHGDDGPLDLKMELERSVFEDLTSDLVERTLTITQRTLDSAKISAADLDEVILVGGQTRSVHVRQRLVERFGKRPSTHVHPDEAVALGASLVARAIFEDRPVDLTDVLAGSIRIKESEESTSVLLPRGTRLPGEKRFPVALNNAPGDSTRVHLYRGEANAPAENTFLGSLTLPPVPVDCSETAAVVVLHVSADGLMSVTAEHPATDELDELDVLLL